MPPASFNAGGHFIQWIEANGCDDTVEILEI